MKAKGNQISANAGQPYKEQHFTGYANFEMLAINPTKERIAEIRGIPIEKMKIDPEYTSTKDGVTTTNLTILGRIFPKQEMLRLKQTPGPDVPEEKFLNIVIRCETRLDEAQTGNKKFIDDSTRTVYAMSLDEAKEKYKYLNPNKLRAAYGGEASLYQFLFAMSNLYGSTNDAVEDFELDDKDPSKAFLKIANGDIKNTENAKQALLLSGADGVMIGRGCYGKPWLINQINQALHDVEISATPSITTQKNIVLQHLHDMIEHYGLDTGLSLAKKHLGWYSSGLKDSAEFRANINHLDTSQKDVKEKIIDLIENFYCKF
jgi:hypothetical protein